MKNIRLKAQVEILKEKEKHNYDPFLPIYKQPWDPGAPITC